MKLALPSLRPKGRYRIMSTLEKAIAIAATAHAGQIDKAGVPYIMHPLRLMMKMQTEAEMQVAVLHDVVEDSRAKENEVDRWTFEKLRQLGFSEDVLQALDCVTDREGEGYDEFIKRAASNPIARRVKIADLEDNMNMLRINEITANTLTRLEKYHKAWHYLTRKI